MDEKKSKEGPGVPGSRKKEGESGKKIPPRKDPLKTILMWVAIAAAVVFALRTLDGAGGPREVKISFSQFQELLVSPEIKIVKAHVVQKGLERAQFQGEVSDAASLTKLSSLRNATPTKYFTVNLPYIDAEMLAQWDKAGFEYIF